MAASNVSRWFVFLKEGGIPTWLSVGCVYMRATDASEAATRRLGLPAEHIPTSLPRAPQLSYKNKFALSMSTNLQTGEFVLVPSIKSVRGSPHIEEEVVGGGTWPKEVIVS